MKTGRVALIGALVTYAGLMLVSIWLLSFDTLTQAYARYTIALLPIGSAIPIVILATRRYQKLDELAQTIHLIALSVAFVGTLLLVFTWALLEYLGLLEIFGTARLSSFLAFGALVGLYLVGLLWARHRYR